MARKRKPPPRRKAVAVAQSNDERRLRHLVESMIDATRNAEERLSSLENVKQRLDNFEYVLQQLENRWDDLQQRLRRFETANLNNPTMPVLAREVLAIKNDNAVNEHFHERLRAIEQSHQQLAAEVNRLRVYGRREDDRAQLEQIVKDAASAKETGKAS
jgi:hypothetical protein